MINAIQALGVIPWYTFGPWELGPVTIQGFGLLVGIGVFLAYQICTWRAPKFGLDVEKMQSLVLAMLFSGFIGSHIIDIILYMPEKLLSDPKILFNFGSTLSSYGGIIGSMVGMGIWKLRNPDEFLTPYADVAAFALPVGWLFGRAGCAVVHDHPGTPSDFFLAVYYEARGESLHDLGLYEALWWVVIVALFFFLSSRLGQLTRRRPGFYIYLLPLVYAPVRFSLDFLRTTDKLYFGLTPAQYLSLGFFVWGAVMMTRWKQQKTMKLKVTAPKPTAADLEAKAEAEKEDD